MKELNVDERKKILLDMIIQIDEFCRSHRINYFLTGGTLLGAIRHKGFIPWDDDIDIAMFRDDYNRFISVFNDEHKGNLRWIDINNTNNYYLASGKIIDTRTELIENVKCAIPIGVFIDIFPIDYVGNDKQLAIRKISKKMLIERIIPLKNAEVSRNRNLIENLVILICKLYPFNERTMAIRREKRNRRIAVFEETKYVANLYGAWGIKEITLNSNFKSFIETEFEGHRLMIPEGYDNLLTDLYGDYMKLPPIEKRVSHHGNIAYWKETC